MSTFRVERRADHGSVVPSDRFFVGTLHYFIDDKEVDELTFLFAVHNEDGKPYRRRYNGLVNSLFNHDCWNVIEGEY